MTERRDPVTDLRRIAFLLGRSQEATYRVRSAGRGRRNTPRSEPREYHHPMARTRPNLLQWVWYAYGGGLPEHLREWVLHDLTCRTWVLRHLSRTLTQWVPTLLLMLLPGPLSLRLSLPALVLIGALYVSISYLEETTEHRLAKHGFPLGMAKEMRRARLETATLDDPRPHPHL